MNELESPVSFHVLVPKNRLKQPTERHPFDTYYGMITLYDITKNKAASGSGRSPSYSHSLFYINELKHKFPDEDEILKIIYRKTVYLHILKKEIRYLSERYDWNKGEGVKDLFLSRFENFTNSLVELIMISINLYARRTQNKSLKRFEDIFPNIIDQNNSFPSYYQSINFSVNLTSYVYIRNSLAHDPREIKYLPNNQNPILQIENIPPNVRYGNFDKYIEEEFEHYKQNGGKISKNTCQSYIDPRFPYLEFEFWLQKNSKVNVRKTKIRFKMNIVELTKMMFNDLIRLQKDMFEIINKFTT